MKRTRVEPSFDHALFYCSGLPFDQTNVAVPGEPQGSSSERPDLGSSLDDRVRVKKIAHIWNSDGVCEPKYELEVKMAGREFIATRRQDQLRAMVSQVRIQIELFAISR